MRVALAHHVFFPGGFMDGVTDGIAGGDAQLAQEEHGGGREILTMPLVGAQ